MKLFFLLCLFAPAFAALFLSGCATAHHAGAPKGEIDVIAHRGASAYTPENTLTAFEKAFEMQADWYELDCMLSADEEVFILHDDDLDRTTNGAGDATEKTLEELRKLDAGAWFAPEFSGEKLPTLDECLNMAKGRIGVYIEVKSCDDDAKLIQSIRRHIKGHTRMTRALRRKLITMVEEAGSRNLHLARKVIERVRAHGMEHEVVIQSFSPVVCLVTLTEALELRTEFLGGENKEHPEAYVQFLELGYFMGVHGFNLHHETLTRERLAAFHRGGKTVAVWTVDDPAVMKRLQQWGVDAIITNRPDLCRETLTKNKE